MITTAGYVCTACGQWIAYGWGHQCGAYQNPYQQAVHVYYHQENLDEVIRLLREIKEKLESKGESTKEP